MENISSASEESTAISEEVSAATEVFVIVIDTEAFMGIDNFKIGSYMLMPIKKRKKDDK